MTAFRFQFTLLKKKKEMYRKDQLSWRFIIFLTLFPVVKCHPISMHNADKAEMKDEKRYTNGTVIGRYEYKDEEGNPIQVKYYADESRYGVELNSLKIIQGDADLPSLESKRVKVENEFNSTDPSFGSAEEFLDPIKDANNMQTKEGNKAKKNYKSLPSADYEIYLPNDFKTSKKCSNEKVRVYNFDKPKRTMRNALEDDEMTKFCEQY